jgi:hypothetical protein
MIYSRSWWSGVNDWYPQFNTIWFGIVLPSNMETGLITPPIPGKKKGRRCFPGPVACPMEP